MLVKKIKVSYNKNLTLFDKRRMIKWKKQAHLKRVHGKIFLIY